MTFRRGSIGVAMSTDMGGWERPRGKGWSPGRLCMRSHRCFKEGRRRRLVSAALGLSVMAAVGTAAPGIVRAQTGIPSQTGSPSPTGFPAQPVHILIPFGAGGVADLTMRLLAQKLTERTRQQVVI